MSFVARHRFIITRTIFVHSTEGINPQPLGASWRYRLIDCDTGIQYGDVMDDQQQAFSLYFELNNQDS